MDIFPENSKVLITGGSGFIGTNLVEYYIGRGVPVTNIDISRPLISSADSFWCCQDILDRQGLEHVFQSVAPTHVIHLAARTGLEENESIDGYAANTQGVNNVLHATSATSSVRRIVIASSMLVCRIGYTPQSYTDYCPPNLYGQSKVLTETISREYGLQIPWTIIRPTTIWGPWSLRYRDEFFKVLIKGVYLHPGSKKIIKSYGYVGNVVHQIDKILRVPESLVNGKTLYVGDQPINLKEWVDGFSVRLRGKKVSTAPITFMRMLALLGDLLASAGVRFPLSSFRLVNMTNDNSIDIGPTLEITGPNPYSLAEGIDITVKWLREQAAVRSV